MLSLTPLAPRVIHRSRQADEIRSARRLNVASSCQCLPAPHVLSLHGFKHESRGTSVDVLRAPVLPTNAPSFSTRSGSTVSRSYGMKESLCIGPHVRLSDGYTRRPR